MEEITKITKEIFPKGSPLENAKGDNITKEELNETVMKTFSFFESNNVSEFVEKLRQTNSPFYAIFQQMDIESFYLSQMTNKEEIEELTRKRFNIPESKECIISIKFE